MAREILNDKPFQYLAHNGTNFTASRCDFTGGVKAEVPNRLSQEQVMQDVGEMSGYHAVNIWPYLNGFAGYDCIRYTITRK